MDNNRPGGKEPRPACAPVCCQVDRTSAAGRPLAIYALRGRLLALRPS